MKLRSPTHAGSIECAGILVERAHIGEARAKARVLELWARGTVVRSCEVGYVVRLPRPRRFDARTAPGGPLVLVGRDALAAMPLDEDELAQLSPHSGGIVVARGAKAYVLEASREPIDVSAWIDLSEWSVADPEALAEPPKPEPFAEPSEKTTAASILVPLLAAEGRPTQAIEIAEALQRDDGARAGDPYRSNPRVTGPFLTAMLLAFSRVLSRLRGGPARAPSGETAPMDSSAPSRASRSAAVGPARGRRGLMAKLESWVARMLLATRLASWLGARQADYVGKLLAMFDRGDLDAALRHAIALGGKASDQPAFSLDAPRPRSDLAISNEQTVASSTIYASDDLYAELRRRYRAAVARLEAEGRIEEAAFVLAELLMAEEEAVAFLERHGRLRKAAELAEGRGLAPGLVVRQWFLAGDRARAVRVARAHGCFGDAILRLERSEKHEDAKALRWVWAESLAAVGDFAGAVDVAWPVGSTPPVEETRDRVVRWIDRAIDAGGPSGARMLAAKIGNDLGEPADLLGAALPLLSGEGIEARSLRHHFAQSLVSRQRGRATQGVARATARALYGDVEHGDRDLKQILQRMHEVAGDSGLDADRPKLSERTLRLSPYRRVIAENDRGTHELWDAISLPKGKTLVALGALGVGLFDRTGKRLFHFDRPANRLVASDHGDRALAIRVHEGFWALARIDVDARRSEAWAEAELTGAAHTFDGSLWVVSGPQGRHGVDLLVLDATLNGLEIVRKHERIGSTVHEIARFRARCEVITGAFEWPVQRVWFELPSWTMRGKEPAAPLNSPSFAANERGDTVEVGRRTEDAPCTLSILNEAPPVFPRRGSVVDLGTYAEEPTAVRLGASFLVVVVRGKGYVRAIFYAWPSCEMTGEVVLVGSTRATVRVDDSLVTLSDDLGRLLLVDPMSGELARDLRV